MTVQSDLTSIDPMIPSSIVRCRRLDYERWWHPRLARHIAPDDHPAGSRKAKREKPWRLRRGAGAAMQCNGRQPLNYGRRRFLINRPGGGIHGWDGVGLTRDSFIWPLGLPAVCCCRLLRFFFNGWMIDWSSTRGPGTDLRADAMIGLGQSTNIFRRQHFQSEFGGQSTNISSQSNLPQKRQALYRYLYRYYIFNLHWYSVKPM